MQNGEIGTWVCFEFPVLETGIIVSIKNRELHTRKTIEYYSEYDIRLSNGDSKTLIDFFVKKYTPKNDDLKKFIEKNSNLDKFKLKSINSLNNKELQGYINKDILKLT